MIARRHIGVVLLAVRLERARTLQALIAAGRIPPADAALIAAASQPGTFVNAYLVEVTGHTPAPPEFIGRDRLKETIRSAGPTVGNSLKSHESA